jgi:hypothetical protein
MDRYAAEVQAYVHFIESRETTSSSRDFWLDQKSRFPNLYRLYERLVHIPAASAFLEQFFSVAGHVEGAKRCNMSDDLLISRALLKANNFVFALL